MKTAFWFIPWLILSFTVLTGCQIESNPLPRGFAIIYGVAEYSEINNLNFPDDDATDLYNLLTAPDQGFDPADVILRTNAQATRGQLELDFNRIAGRMSELPDPSLSRFIFYFAGHGYGDGMTKYYSFPGPWQEYFGEPGDEPVGAGIKTDYLFLHSISVDGHATAAEVGAELQANAESDDDLAAHLAGIRSRQKIVIIDACHSGGFIGDGTSVDSVPLAFDGDESGISMLDGLQALSVYASGGADSGADIGPDTLVMTAAGEQDFSYEYSVSVGIENGVFTHYLLETPSAADSNSDGFVTVSEAYRHASSAIIAGENPYLYGEDKFVPRLGSIPVDFVLFKAR